MRDPRLERYVHRLPEPLPVRSDEPFVGNERLGENLEEAVRVALWKATGGCCEGIGAEVFGGRVVLSGQTASAEAARACEAEVRGIAGVTSVTNLLSWNASEPDPAP